MNIEKASDNVDGAESGFLTGRSRTWLLVVCSLGVLLVISSMVALNAALGAIATDTLATQAELTWIVDGYTLVMACLLLPAGALGDRYGRRRVMLIGLVIFAAASLAPIYFDSPMALITARSLTGVGAAAILPATLSLLTAAYPDEERTKAIGIWAGVCGSTAIVGFMGTAIITQFGSWRTIFWAFTVGAVLLLGLALTISSSKDPDATPIDWWGALLIGAAIAAFVFGVIEAPLRGWSDPLVYGCLAGGIGLAVVFGLVEIRSKKPLLDIRVFKDPNMLTGSIGMTTLFFAMFGFFFLIMQYMQLVMSYTPLHTAVALTPLAIPLLVLAGLTQWFLPRFGLRLSVASGLAILAGGLLCMRQLDVDSTYFDLAWPMLVLSAGMGICNAPSTTAITGAVPLSKQGVASAINDTTRELGGALGIALAGSILAASYSSALASSVEALPPAVKEPALASLAQALQIADRIGPPGSDLARQANDAFMISMQSSLLLLAIVVLISAVVVAIWGPGRDGRQLRILRRFWVNELRTSQGSADSRDDAHERRVAN